MSDPQADLLGTNQTGNADITGRSRKRTSGHVFSKTIACLTFLLLSTAVTADDTSQVIKVNFTNRTVEPARPTFNINATHSVTIVVDPPGQYGIFPALAFWGAVNDVRHRGNIRFSTYTPETGSDEELEAEGSQVTLNFYLSKKKDAPIPCRYAHKAPKGGDAAIEMAYQDGSPLTYTVCLEDRGPRVYVVRVRCLPEKSASCKAANGDPSPALAVGIFIDSAGFTLDWSAGFSFPYLRDQRYRSEPIPGDDQNASLVRIRGDGPVPFQLAAFAHYCGLGNGVSFCPFSVGLATNLSSGLQVMAGPAFRIPTIPLVDSMYITAGGVYGQRKVLNDSYVGIKNPKIPIHVSADSVLSEQYRLSVFLSISFGFLGSNSDKFRGVYSGLASGHDNSKNTEAKPVGDVPVTQTPPESKSPPAPPPPTSPPPPSPPAAATSQ